MSRILRSIRCRFVILDNEGYSEIWLRRELRDKFFASLCFRDVHREMGLSLSRSLDSTKHQTDLCLMCEFCLRVASMFSMLFVQCVIQWWHCTLGVLFLDGRACAMQHAYVTWDVTRRVKKKKSNNTHTLRDVCSGFQDSFHEHLGGRDLSSLEPFDVMLMEAKVIRMTHNTSERSLSFQWALFLSLLWSHGECLSFRCNR